jgi:hypothetical protein
LLIVLECTILVVGHAFWIFRIPYGNESLKLTQYSSTRKKY